MTLTRKITMASAAAACAATAFGTGWWAHTPDIPSCPTEDSCVADYRDGGWDVVEVTP